MLSEFAYVGVDPAGREGRGVIAAADRRDALARLRERGVTVIDLAEGARRPTLTAPARGGRLRQQDVYALVREMATLLRSGMQIDKALEILIQSADKEEVRGILASVLTDIRAGKGVAPAFQETGRFSPFIIHMIRNNEEIGRLGDAFESIARYLQFQIRFRGEIRDALVYPVFLVSASILTFFVIFQFIVPRFLGIFGASPAGLPASAQALFVLSRWLSLKNLLIAAASFLAVPLANRLFGAKIDPAALRDRLLRLPLVRTLMLNLELSRFAYSMHAMLDAGVEFIKALRLSTDLVHHAVLRQSLEAAEAEIRGGRKIADAFAGISSLPSLVPSMIRVGEESGRLREIFLEIHQIFDERFKTSVKRGLTLLEPAIIVAMGLIVGFIVLTLIQTVMSVGSLKL